MTGTFGKGGGGIPRFDKPIANGTDILVLFGEDDFLFVVFVVTPKDRGDKAERGAGKYGLEEVAEFIPVRLLEAEESNILWEFIIGDSK